MKIHICIGEMEYGERRWGHVPRVGEFISLEGKKAGEYEIADIVWYGDSCPAVQITVKEHPRKI